MQPSIEPHKFCRELSFVLSKKEVPSFQEVQIAHVQIRKLELPVSILVPNQGLHIFNEMISLSTKNIFTILAA